MAELQRWTGMRPGEVCRLKLEEIDRAGPVWLFRPARHKTRHRGKGRVVPIGPRGQAALLAFLAGRLPAPAGLGDLDMSDPKTRLTAAAACEVGGRPVDAALLRDLTLPVVWLGGSVLDPRAFVFDAARDREERFAEWRANRRSKVPPSQLNRRKERPIRAPAAGYRPHAYAHAVRVACEKARVPHWHPTAAIEDARQWILTGDQAADPFVTHLPNDFDKSRNKVTGLDVLVRLVEHH